MPVITARAVLDTDAVRSPPTGPASGDDEEETAGPSPPGRRLRLVALAGLAYALVALLAYRPILPGDGTRLPSCACGDLVQGVWFLRWTPFALLHGLNPFLTDFIGYPSGVNLAQNTSMPLLGVLAAPVTWVAGPVAGLDTLLWLSFPLSATAAFVALRHWIRRRRPPLWAACSTGSRLTWWARGVTSTCCSSPFPAHPDGGRRAASSATGATPCVGCPPSA